MTTTSFARTGCPAWTFLFSATLGCSWEDPADPVNRAPVVEGQIPDQSLWAGDTVKLNLSGYFSDPDGDALMYWAGATPSHPVGLSISGATLTMTGEAWGTPSIRVTATDPDGRAIAQYFHAEVAITDRRALTDFYNATGGDEWYSDFNWLTEAPLGQWYGIDADENGRVTGIDLFFNRLSGELPQHLESLLELERLSLSYNSLTGNLPHGLGKLSKLKVLDVSVSGIGGGSFPSGIGDLSQLKVLNLSRAGFGGRIPASIGNMANLEELLLFNTQWGDVGLTGPIPAEMGKLARLRTLDLGLNGLTGPIPATLGELGQLRRLSLLRNQLSGNVPPELGRLTQLRELYLLDNHELEGELPPELTALRSLSTFLAGGTGLCAPMDTAFAGWLNGIVRRRIPRCGESAEPAYLTQAVQSMRYPVPLVAGDSALLRVFVTAKRTSSAKIPPVKATFYGEAGEEVHVADIPGLDHVIPTAVNEGNLETSSNAVIPALVVRPGVTMVIQVDPNDDLDPDLGVPKRIPAEGRLKLDVATMPTFNLTVVPMLWKNKPDSAILKITDGLTAEHQLFYRTRNLMPVGDMVVTVHDPVVTTSSSSGALLNDVKRIWIAEGRVGHYAGMMMKGSLYFSGVAEAGGKVSFSIPDDVTIAHEFGHNFSLYHAPCRVPAGRDEAFPQRDGTIGVWGYDFRKHKLLAPNVYDMMSYCWPSWIGDYHFTNALRYRVDDEGPSDGPATSTRVLLVSGGADPEGIPYLDPAIVIDARPSLPGNRGGHRITGHTADGTELFALRFDMPIIADGDGSSFFTFAIPAPDEWAETLASVTLAGGGRSVAIDRDTDRPTAILRDPGTGQIRQVVHELPPGAAARQRATALASGTGFEVFFSRGIPESIDWTR